MNPSLVSKKNKKLFLELDYLYAELDYYEEGLKEAQDEFKEAFYEYSKANNLGYSKPEEQKLETSSDTTLSTFVEEDDEEPTGYSHQPPPPEMTVEESVEPEEKDEDISKLFKKIASITHPDVIPHSEKEELKQKRIQQFMEAQAAHKEKNWYKLCQIAISLGIEIPEPKKKHLKWMEGEGKRIRERIEHIKITFAWVWYNEEEEAKKNNIMRNYFSAIAPKN